MELIRTKAVATNIVVPLVSIGSSSYYTSTTLTSASVISYSWSDSNTTPTIATISGLPVQIDATGLWTISATSADMNPNSGNDKYMSIKIKANEITDQGVLVSLTDYSFNKIATSANIVNSNVLQVTGGIFIGTSAYTNFPQVTVSAYNNLPQVTVSAYNNFPQVNVSAQTNHPAYPSMVVSAYTNFPQVTVSGVNGGLFIGTSAYTNFPSVNVSSVNISALTSAGFSTDYYNKIQLLTPTVTIGKVQVSGIDTGVLVSATYGSDFFNRVDTILTSSHGSGSWQQNLAVTVSAYTNFPQVTVSAYNNLPQVTVSAYNNFPQVSVSAQTGSHPVVSVSAYTNFPQVIVSAYNNLPQVTVSAYQNFPQVFVSAIDPTIQISASFDPVTVSAYQNFPQVIVSANLDKSSYSLTSAYDSSKNAASQSTINAISAVTNKFTFSGSDVNAYTVNQVTVTIPSAVGVSGLSLYAISQIQNGLASAADVAYIQNIVNSISSVTNQFTFNGSAVNSNVVEVSGILVNSGTFSSITVSDILNGVVDTKTLDQIFTILLSNAVGQADRIGNAFNYKKQDGATTAFENTIASPNQRIRTA